MPSSLIRGKYVICRAGADAGSTSVIADGAVFQRDGLIEDVGPYHRLRTTCQPDQEIGGAEYLVFPGLVNAHNHGRGVTTFQLGSCDDSLETWFLAGWGRRPVDWRLMTLYTAMQMVASGTTTVMYNHPQTPTAGLEEEIGQVLRAFGEVGMRVAFSVYLRERNRVVYGDDRQFLASLPADLGGYVGRYLAATDLPADQYFALFQRTHRRYGASPNGKVRVLLSPANVHWVTDEFLQANREYAARYQTGIHMHLVETVYQKAYGQRAWGKTPVAHLRDLDFLGPELSGAHGVWLTGSDIDLLAEHGVAICHNPSSNLRLRSGIAPVNRLLARGVNVALGTDSTALNDDDDLLQEMRLAARLHREPGIDAPAISSHQALRMATSGGAQPTFFPDIGTLEKGRRADLVLLDLKGIEEPYLDPDTDIVDALLYRGKAQQVRTVIIDGQVVLRDGQFTGVDREAVVQEVQAQLSRPVEAPVQEGRRMLRRLLPYVKDFYAAWEPEDARPHYRYNSQ